MLLMLQKDYTVFKPAKKSVSISPNRRSDFRYINNSNNNNYNKINHTNNNCNSFKSIEYGENVGIYKPHNKLRQIFIKYANK